jgi:tripartite-type tricarboxylate transporter receptor subunit TctC
MVVSHQIKSKALALTGLAFCFALPLNIVAADEFPSHPVTLVVAVLPGSATDLIARTLAAPLGKALDQSVVVENKAGAATVLGANFVAKSAADGYTVLVATSSTLSVLPSVAALPFDPVRDLVPVAAYARTPMMILVSSESRFKTLADLVAAARADPGKLTFASTGVGTLTHMSLELFCSVADIKLTHVPYRAAAGSYVDVVAGRIDAVMGAPATARSLISAGKMRPLAISSPQRNPLLPNVPTFAELGYAGAESDFFDGLAVPAGTPPAVIKRLQSGVISVARSAAFKEYLAREGAEPIAADGEAFAQLLQADHAKWVKLVHERNIKVE